jgi:hypothetical protein
VDLARGLGVAPAALAVKLGRPRVFEDIPLLVPVLVLAVRLALGVALAARVIGLTSTAGSAKETLLFS